MASQRDRTEDWLIPPSARPPTVAELEQRIDVAIAIARSSESAVMTVAEAALESARQAKRAAEMAVKASEAAQGNGGDGSAAPTRGPAPAHEARKRAVQEDAFTRFCRRADSLGARLERLQRR